MEELSTDIYIFLTRDGSNRVKVVEHGDWLSWVDESTLYFHRIHLVLPQKKRRR